MQKRQISNLNAGYSVITVLERHHDALPEAAHECHDELIELTDKIMENGRKQQTKSGTAAQKKQALDALVDTSVTVAGALCSYGTKVGDNRLVAACAYTRSTLTEGRDADFSSRCSDLLDEATPLLDKLGKYKITAATLKDLKGRIVAYDEVRISPRAAIQQSAAATKRLPKLTHKMRVLLGQRLDPLIAPFEATDPKLHSEYRKARKLVNLPTQEKTPKTEAKADTTTTQPKTENSSDKSLKVVTKPDAPAGKNAKPSAKPDAAEDKSNVA